MARKLEIQIVGNTRDFERAMGRATRSAGGFGSSLGRVAKGAAFAAGAAGIGALTVGLKAGWDEFNEGQKVAAQTNAVLKSTGGVANVTAKDIDRLSESLMKKTGIDDEAIKSGANLLLTFTNIRNEAGKGNDIFTQATRTVQDMSVALGQDTKSSAIQVGKALNDPIRGITALRRVGVSFTKAQEEQIKKLVESGKTMEAQKLILKELNKEFGGSAEAAGKTFAGQMNILKETFSNAAGEMVGRLMPVVVRFAKWALPLIVKGLDLVIRGATWLGDKFTEVSNRVGGEGGRRFEKLGTILRSVGDWIRTNLVPIIRKLGDIFQDAVGRIASVISEHREELERIWKRVGAAIKAVAKVALPILRFLFVEVLPRVVGVAITALDKISGALERVIGFFRHFRSNATSILSNVRDAIKARIDRIVGFFRDLPGRAASAITALAGKLRDAINGLFSKVIGWAKEALGIASPSAVFAEIGRNVVRGFINGVGSMGGLLKKAVVKIAKSVVGFFGGTDPLGGVNAGSLVEVGRRLQRLGFQVGEHPAFGGVSGVHSPNSYHYKGRAIDVNWPGGGPGELSHLRNAYSVLSRIPHAELLLEDVGRANQHLHFAMRKGGYIGEHVVGVGLRSGASYEFGERGGEYVVPAGKGGVRDVHFHGPVYGSPAEIARMVKRELAFGDLRNS